MSGIEAISENNPSRTVWNRSEIVFLAAATAALVGAIFQIPTLALDILWVCVLSLTIAAAVIFPAASSTADLKGFALLLSGPALLRIALVGAVCSQLPVGNSGGFLITATGKALTGSWPLPAALVCLVGAAALVTSLFAACQKITAASERYLLRIRPLKCVGIETDLKLGVITAEQARTLAAKVHDESRLFVNLSGASRLMRTEGVIDITAVLLCMVWPFFGTASQAGSGMDRIAQAAAAAVGLTIFSLVPAAVSAMAGAYLAGKDSLTLRTASTQQESSGRTFTLVDQETGRQEEIELLNPECVAAGRPFAASDNERVAEFEPEHESVLIETLALSTASEQTYYRQLAAHVAAAADASRVIVFSARQVRRLPVTVFVNTAIQLVQEGRKVLLVDADRRRNALAQVFEMDPGQLTEAICATRFEGLDLYSIGEAADRTPAALAEAAQTYACILIYAPEAAAQETLEGVVGTLDPAAFVFDGDAASAPRCCKRIFVVPSCNE